MLRSPFTSNSFCSTFPLSYAPSVICITLLPSAPPAMNSHYFALLLVCTCLKKFQISKFEYYGEFKHSFIHIFALDKTARNKATLGLDAECPISEALLSLLLLSILSVFVSIISHHLQLQANPKSSLKCVITENRKYRKYGCRRRRNWRVFQSLRMD